MWNNHFFKKLNLILLRYILFYLSLLLFKQLFLNLLLGFTDRICFLDFLIKPILFSYIHKLLSELSSPSRTLLETLMLLSLLFVGIPELLLTMSFVSVDFAEGLISYVIFDPVACWELFVRNSPFQLWVILSFIWGLWLLLHGGRIYDKLGFGFAKFWWFQGKILLERHKGFTFYPCRIILSFVGVIVEFVHMRLRKLMPIIILQFIKSALNFGHLSVMLHLGCQ